MICKKCGYRYAPFPNEDFDFIEKYNPMFHTTIQMIPINDGVEEKRMKVFDSNDIGVCDLCVTDEDI